MTSQHNNQHKRVRDDAYDDAMENLRHWNLESDPKILDEVHRLMQLDRIDPLMVLGIGGGVSVMLGAVTAYSMFQNPMPGLIIAGGGLMGSAVMMFRMLIKNDDVHRFVSKMGVGEELLAFLSPYRSAANYLSGKIHLTDQERGELDRSVMQANSSLVRRVWQEWAETGLPVRQDDRDVLMRAILMAKRKQHELTEDKEILLPEGELDVVADNNHHPAQRSHG